MEGCTGPLYRHGRRRVPFCRSRGNASRIRAIEAHITRHVGPIAWVMHEIESDLVHVDIHVVEPTRQGPFYTLVTSGMSEVPMKVPALDGVALTYAELSICLPSTWPLDTPNVLRTHYAWPVKWLQSLARFPHLYDTWLGIGHTIPNGDPPEPFAPDTGFSSIVLLPSIMLPEAFGTLRLGESKRIEFLAVYPLYPEELDLKLGEGLDPLLDRFERCSVTDLLDLRRPNTCAARHDERPPSATR